MTNKYTYEINEDNSFAVLVDGDAVVFASRPFRLRVQAETQAKEWIKNQTGYPIDSINLTVQSLVVDPDTLFRRLTNG